MMEFKPKCSCSHSYSTYALGGIGREPVPEPHRHSRVDLHSGLTQWARGASVWPLGYSWRPGVECPQPPEGSGAGSQGVEPCSSILLSNSIRKRLKHQLQVRLRARPGRCRGGEVGWWDGGWRRDE